MIKVCHGFCHENLAKYVNQSNYAKCLRYNFQGVDSDSNSLEEGLR